MSITHAQEYDIKKSFFTNLRREYVGKHYYLRDDKVFSIGNAISFAAMKTVRDHIEKDLIALGEPMLEITDDPADTMDRFKEELKLRGMKI